MDTTGDPPPPGLAVRVLGAPALVVDGQEQAFPPGRPGRLLAVLLLARGRTLTVDRLVDDVWAEDLPGDARGALHTTVGRTRRALGAGGDRLVREDAGYRLDVTGATIDADVFTAALTDARARRDLTAYDAALALWRGPAWVPWADDVAQGEALRLEEARLAAREERVALLLDQGRVAEAVGDLRQLVAEHPLRDRPVVMLMDSLHRSGAAAEALAVFAAHRRALAEELGLDPAPELLEMQRQVLNRESPPARPRAATDAPSGAQADVPATHRPPTAVLFGRDVDLADLGTLLDLHRVVTLVGPGGVGKTALARRATAEEPSLWWVDLASVTTEAGVRSVTATALGVEVFPGGTPEAALRRRLATAEGTLVLDNCEHVVGAACDLVAEVAEHGTRLRVLATSRERLGLPEEHVFWLSPLELPPADGVDLSVPSVALFLERARAASPDLVVDDATAAAVTRLVRTLDGLPLAIELAASRVGVVSLSTLQRRLEDHLDLLQRHHRRRGPARHQTLAATIGWSYDLLTPEEQRVFRWLSTFAGPFELDDAEAVLGEGSVEATIALVERSLLVRPGGNRDEYRMLETLRSFARGRLEDDEHTQASAAHAAWAASVAARAREGLRTADEAQWHHVVERRLPDVGGAVRWALGRDELGLAADIVSDLYDWAYFRVRLDVLAWGREVADRSSGRDDHPGALAAASTHAWMLGEHDLAAGYGRRGVEAGGGPGRPEALLALSAWADTALAVGELDRAHELCWEGYTTAAAHGLRTQQVVFASALVLAQVYRGRSCARELELLWEATALVEAPSAVAFARYTEAEALAASDPARALELLAEARALARPVHSRLTVGVSLAAETALRGRVGSLDAHTVEQTVLAIQHWLGSGNENLFVTCLRNVVPLLDRFGSHRECVALVAATEAHTQDRPPYGAEKDRIEAALTHARAELSGSELEAAWREGWGSSLEEAALRTVRELRRLV